MSLNYQVFICALSQEMVESVGRMALRLGCSVVGSGSAADLKEFSAAGKAVDLLLCEDTALIRQSLPDLMGGKSAATLFFRPSDLEQPKNGVMPFGDNVAEDGKWRLAMMVAVEKNARQNDLRSSRAQLYSAGATRMMVAKAQSCQKQESSRSGMQGIYQMQIRSQGMGISLRQMAQRVYTAGKTIRETA